MDTKSNNTTNTHTVHVAEAAIIKYHHHRHHHHPGCNKNRYRLVAKILAIKTLCGSTLWTQLPVRLQIHNDDNHHHHHWSVPMLPLRQLTMHGCFKMFFVGIANPLVVNLQVVLFFAVEDTI
jgi:hypothetical protein